MMALPLVVGVTAGEIDPWAGADRRVPRPAGVTSDPTAFVCLLDREDVAEPHFPVLALRERAVEGHEMR